MACCDKAIEVSRVAFRDAAVQVSSFPFYTTPGCVYTTSVVPEVIATPINRNG
jgi:hypothetical protein